MGREGGSIVFQTFHRGNDWEGWDGDERAGGEESYCKMAYIYGVCSNDQQDEKRPGGKKRRKKRMKCGQESPELRVAMSEMYLPTRASFGSDFPHMLK